MRAVFLLSVVLLGAIVLWFGARAVVRVARPPDANALMAPLLPQGAPDGRCRASRGTTTGRARPLATG